MPPREAPAESRARGCMCCSAPPLPLKPPESKGSGGFLVWPQQEVGSLYKNSVQVAEKISRRTRGLGTFLLGSHTARVHSLRLCRIEPWLH
jgi:hypothetical protein